MKSRNTIKIFIFVLFILSLIYFVKPFDIENLEEGFRGRRGGGGRRSGGRRGGGRRGGGMRRSGGRRGGMRRSGGRRGHMRRRGGRRARHGYRRGYRRGLRRGYNYGGGYGGGYGGYYGGYNYPYYSSYDYLASPYTWGSPYGYNVYNWFDYSNCPPGCVANSSSPSGFSCNRSSSGVSCLTDYDCSGCNVPLVGYSY